VWCVCGVCVVCVVCVRGVVCGVCVCVRARFCVRAWCMCVLCMVCVVCVCPYKISDSSLWNSVSCGREKRRIKRIFREVAIVFFTTKHGGMQAQKFLKYDTGVALGFRFMLTFWRI